ncbi:MAG: GTPase [Planctomycetaceae bacterium]
MKSDITSSSVQAALLTPRGRGAVATIRVQGIEAGSEARWQHFFRAANEKPLAAQDLGRIVFGRWGDEAVEEVVISRIDERNIEIHCHGGEAAARRILNDLESAGAEVSTWTRMLAGQEGVLASECADALAHATTIRTATILLEQQSGILAAAIEELRSAPFPAPGAVHSLQQLLRWANFGVHLTKPWEVVLTGRPNVGKSSLINALVGYARSIVYAEPGTTRDVVTAETALDGWPIQFADTAGIRESTDAIESEGIDRARRKLRDADCRVLLIDTSRAPHDDDLALISACPDSIIVAHKSDLPDAWGSAVPAGALRVSSLTGTGVEMLSRAIVARVVPEVPARGTPLPVSDTIVASLSHALAAWERRDERGYVEILDQLIAR